MRLADWVLRVVLRGRIIPHLWYNTSFGKGDKAMFTGLIREKASVVSFSGDVLTLKASYRPRIGDSIAINGACLTAVRVGEGLFSVELSPETRAHIAHENLTAQVHMEPAMQVGDRLDGHFVQGHVDAIGQITKLEHNGNALEMYIALPKEAMVCMIPKGSVAIDGVSLTINAVSKEEIRLTLIPLTLQDTLLGTYRVGRRVNVESDMLVRSLHHMLSRKKEKGWEEVEHWMRLY